MASRTNRPKGSNPVANSVVILSSREEGPSVAWANVTVRPASEFESFAEVASRLLHVPKDELDEKRREADEKRRARGRAITREIESDPAEVEALRRARQQVREGNTSDLDGLDERIAAEEDQE
jgi:hypothetical protein